MPQDTDLSDACNFQGRPDITAVKIRYFAALREQAGCTGEDLDTEALTVGELFAELSGRHGFSLGADLVKFAINQEYRPADQLLQAGDEVVFIPPVNGG